MELVKFLEREGFTMRKHGNSWLSKQCPYCGDDVNHSNIEKLSAFSDDEAKEGWVCHQCGEKGDLADAHCHLAGIF